MSKKIIILVTTFLTVLVFVNVKLVLANEVIDSDLKLSSDRIYEGDVLINSGRINLNGFELIINGDLIQGGGDLFVNNGKLQIGGDYRLQNKNADDTYSSGSGRLYMINDSDYVIVNGSFITQGNNHSNCLTAGTLEVGGDFIQQGLNASSDSSSAYSFNAGETHKVILSGTGIQRISFEDYINSGFSYLEVTNNTNIVFETYVRGFSASSDIVVSGNLFMVSGTLNLRRFSLTINGNLIQGGGVVYVNGGRLNIFGDYRLQRIHNNGTYYSSLGYLYMIRNTDYVLVAGSFITEGINHTNNLSAGVLEVKGDFVQLSSNSIYSFNASGTHKVILSGSNIQRISFDSYSSSGFRYLDITNNTDNIILETYIGGFLLSGNFTFDGNLKIGGGTLDLNGYTLTINGNLIQDGGTIDLNGCTLIINGDLIQGGGAMNINAGKLNISGDYRLQLIDDNGVYSYSTGYLSMTKNSDYIIVYGDFIANGTSNRYKLTAGTLEVKGDFIQMNSYSSYNFCAEEAHNVVLSGLGIQKVSFDSVDSGFNNLNIRNSLSNIKLDTNLKKFNLYHNDILIKYPIIFPVTPSLNLIRGQSAQLILMNYPPSSTVSVYNSRTGLILKENIQSDGWFNLTLSNPLSTSSDYYIRFTHSDIGEVTKNIKLYDLAQPEFNGLYDDISMFMGDEYKFNGMLSSDTGIIESVHVDIYDADDTKTGVTYYRKDNFSGGVTSSFDFSSLPSFKLDNIIEDYMNPYKKLDTSKIKRYRIAIYAGLLGQKDNILVADQIVSIKESDFTVDELFFTDSFDNEIISLDDTVLNVLANVTNLSQVRSMEVNMIVAVYSKDNEIQHLKIENVNLSAGETRKIEVALLMEDNINGKYVKEGMYASVMFWDKLEAVLPHTQKTWGLVSK